MNSTEQVKTYRDLTSRCEKILLSKREDYAGEDVLSNFKDAGKIVGISPDQQCLSLIAVKVARLGQLLKGKTPNNESIEDSILDLFNYSALLFMIRKDNQNEKTLIHSHHTCNPFSRILSILKNLGANYHKRGHQGRVS